jgi:hypothetical protein
MSGGRITGIGYRPFYFTDTRRCSNGPFQAYLTSTAAFATGCIGSLGLPAVHGSGVQGVSWVSIKVTGGARCVQSLGSPVVHVLARIAGRPGVSEHRGHRHSLHGVSATNRKAREHGQVLVNHSMAPNFTISPTGCTPRTDCIVW